MKNPRRRKAGNASQQVLSATRNPPRRKAIELARSQILQTPGKANPDGRKACLLDSESVGDFTKDGLKYSESLLGLRRSVVSLSCSTDVGKFSCSGTVVDHDHNKTWILTSACLVRKRDTQFKLHDTIIKIEVFLPNEKVVEGSLEMYSFHYNIAIVTIESPESKLPAVDLKDLPECYSMQPRPVVALGRDAFSKAFLMKHGMLVRKMSELDCKELLVSTCDISLDFIGGPMMDHKKRFIGITFSYEDTTPFLPVEIAARCLRYFKKEKTLPSLRIKVQALHTLDADVLEYICCNFARPPVGVIVNKICYESTNMEVGDIITELDGVTIYSAAQFTAMLLDKLELASGTLNTVTVTAVVRSWTNNRTFLAVLNVQDIASFEDDKSSQNRSDH